MCVSMVAVELLHVTADRTLRPERQSKRRADFAHKVLRLTDSNSALRRREYNGISFASFLSKSWNMASLVDST